MHVEIHPWALQLTDKNLFKNTKTISTKNQIPSPPGFKEITTTSATRSIKKKTKVEEDNVTALLIQKAWQIALAPAKTIPMNLIMSYMSGTSLQIIPIMTALMLLSGPVKAIFNTREAFKPVLDSKNIQSEIVPQMGLYVLFQIALMYIGLRKLNAMGLIPNTKSDWLSWETVPDFNGNIKSFAF